MKINTMSCPLSWVANIEGKNQCNIHATSCTISFKLPILSLANDTAYSTTNGAQPIFVASGNCMGSSAYNEGENFSMVADAAHPFTANVAYSSAPLRPCQPTSLQRMPPAISMYHPKLPPPLRPPPVVAALPAEPEPKKKIMSSALFKRDVSTPSFSASTAFF